MALLIIQDPLHKEYHQVFEEVLQKADVESGQGIDVQLDCAIESANLLNFLLMRLYTDIRLMATGLGYSYKFNIDILFNTVDNSCYSTIYHVKSEPIETSSIHNKISSIDIVPSDLETPGFENRNNSNIATKCHTVAVGGTFDHIHDGHKILLSIAIYLTEKVLIIGITDDELLQRKQYKEYLESFETRLRITNAFVQKLGNSNQEFDFYRINDVYGPTGYLKAIDSLVISKESAKGGEMVNERRQELNLPELQVFTIDLVGGENKLSSTDLRRLDMEREESYKRRKLD